jgi:hypothetical protein
MVEAGVFLGQAYLQMATVMAGIILHSQVGITEGKQNA